MFTKSCIFHLLNIIPATPFLQKPLPFSVSGYSHFLHMDFCHNIFIVFLSSVWYLPRYTPDFAQYCVSIVPIISQCPPLMKILRCLLLLLGPSSHSLRCSLELLWSGFCLPFLLFSYPSSLALYSDTERVSVSSICNAVSCLMPFHGCSPLISKHRFPFYSPHPFALLIVLYCNVKGLQAKKHKDLAFF